MNSQPNPGLLTRRETLKRGVSGIAAMALSGACGQAAPAVARRARARSVIQIWMWGGPSHLDTFDPKPDAGYDYCGPLDKPIGTNVDGIQIGQLLPILARQADKYSIIRSMTHGVNAHETASYITQTGRRSDRLVYPCAGAVVALFRGSGLQTRGLVPPYIVLTTPQGRFSEAGFLGQAYGPFATGGDPNAKQFFVEGIVAQGISDQRQRNRKMLLRSLDSLGSAMPGNVQFKQFDECEENAYEMMFGDAKRLYDLSEESDAMREQYGRNTFGQSCLMARRLVEHGVPYVTINYKGWDTHKRHFEIMRRKLPELDRGMGTLIADLEDRGLLDSTIVWWSGEFGRTPKIQWQPPWNGGRGHHGNCFTAVVAGGGFRGGQVVGASDSKGVKVAQRPVNPRDLIGSIYELLGIDPEAPMPNPRGLDVRVMPSIDEDRTGASRLKEIMG